MEYPWSSRDRCKPMVMLQISRSTLVEGRKCPRVSLVMGSGPSRDGKTVTVETVPTTVKVKPSLNTLKITEKDTVFVAKNSEVKNKDERIESKANMEGRDGNTNDLKDDKTVITASIDDTKVSKISDDTGSQINEAPNSQNAPDSIENDASEEQGQEGGEKEESEALTDQQIQAIKTKTLKSLETNLTILSDIDGHLTENGTLDATFRKAAFNLQDCHFTLKKASLEIYNNFKTEQGAVIVELGGVKIVCDVIVYCVRKGYYGEADKLIQSVWLPLINSAIVLVNFTDSNPKFAPLLVEHGDFLPQVCDALQTLRESHLEGNIRVKDAKILGFYLSIIHNIAQSETSIPELRDYGFVEVLMPYLSSKSDKILLSTLATLADLVDESEAKCLERDGEFFTFLLKCLKSAMKDRQRRCKGWSARELARTVRRIARNDVNKKSLVSQGSLPVLVALAQSSHEEEQIEAIGALWTLSFDKENQDIMLQDDAVMKNFINLRTSPVQRIKNACNGALWNMREKLSTVDKYKELGGEYRRDEKEVTSDSPASPGGQRGHVMISYQWANQKIIKKIRDSLLQNGITCWMDIDDMQGSTLNAMAQAVEKADMILICYSKKYYDSPNCRAEAEYAFQLRKPIIPLKMERNYQAREWLGFIIGSKLFFEFTEKYPFESKMSALVKEILTRQKRSVPEKPIIPQATTPHTEKTPATSAGKTKTRVQASEVVKNWTASDVLRWTNHHKLSSSQFSKLTGVEIAFLQVLRHESPDHFYKTLNDMLKIKDLPTMAQFTFALEDTMV